MLPTMGAQVPCCPWEVFGVPPPPNLFRASGLQGLSLHGLRPIPDSQPLAQTARFVLCLPGCQGHTREAVAFLNPECGWCRGHRRPDVGLREARFPASKFPYRTDEEREVPRG